MYNKDDFFMYRSMDHHDNPTNQPEPISMEEKKRYYNLDDSHDLKTTSNNIETNSVNSDDNYFHQLSNISENNNNMELLYPSNELTNINNKMNILTNSQKRLNNDEYNEWSEEELEDEINIKTNKKYINDIVSATYVDLGDDNRGNKVGGNGNGSGLVNKDGFQFVNVNDLINEIGFGKFHYQLIFLCGLGYIADSMWTESITLIINPVQNEFNIPTMYIGWLASTLFLGMCLGSFFWGRLSDVIGRKFPFALTLCIAGIAGMISAFMTSYGLLLVFLFILGLGVGGNIPVDGAILAEFLPSSHRGSIMVSLSIFWALGDLISAMIGYMIVPNNICTQTPCILDDNLGWRYLLFSLGIINCCFLLFRLGTNESPNFLICQGEGGRTRALNVLKTMAITNGVPNKVHDKMILQIDNPNINRSLIQNNTHLNDSMSLDLINIDLETYNMSIVDIFKELFSNKNKTRNLRIATPLIWLSWFGSSFGLSMFSVFLPKFLKHKNIQTNSLYGDALILAIASLPGPFIGAYFVETKKLGRKYTMTIAASLIGLCMLIFLILKDETLSVTFACIISLLDTIYFSGLLCYTPEAYPTDIRTTASGIATAIRHVANILAPIIGGKLFGNDGIKPLLLASASLFIVAISTYLLPFDTRKTRLVPTVRLSL